MCVSFLDLNSKQILPFLFQGDVFAREGLERALFPRAPMRDEMQQEKLQVLPETDDHHVLRVRHKTQSLFVIKYNWLCKRSYRLNYL